MFLKEEENIKVSEFTIEAVHKKAVTPFIEKWRNIDLESRQNRQNKSAEQKKILTEKQFYLKNKNARKIKKIYKKEEMTI